MFLLKIIWAVPLIVFVFAASLILGFFPVIILRLLGLKKASDKITDFLGAIVSDSTLFILGCRVHIEGDIDSLRAYGRSSKKICYVANHTSMLDVPIVLGAMCLPCGFITKSTFKYVPGFNLICLLMHCVFIDRGNTKRGVQSIKAGAKIIENGHPMLIFPEGRRSKTGEIQSFMRGAFRLATMSGAEIVPIVIKGARKALEGRKSVFSRTDCYVRFGEAVPTEGLDRFQAAERFDEIEYKIKSEYDSMQGEF